LAFLEKEVTYLRLQDLLQKQHANFLEMLPHKTCSGYMKFYNLITFSAFTKRIYTHEKRLDVAAMLQACIQKVPELNLGQEASYPDCGCLWFSSVPSDNFLDSAMIKPH
jgi:hypothetical protein